MASNSSHPARFRPSRVLLALVTAAVLLVGCGSGSSGGKSSGGSDGSNPSVTTSADGQGSGADQRFPDVVGVKATNDGTTWTFDVTISSPYDTPERYADGWRVMGPDGKVFGEHELGHDHASEQPFTRTQNGVEIPENVDKVTIESRDKTNGYGGKAFEVDLAAARTEG